jgi:hypothetical protein
MLSRMTRLKIKTDQITLYLPHPIFPQIKQIQQSEEEPHFPHTEVV